MALRTGSRSYRQCMIYMIQYGIDGIETVTNTKDFTLVVIGQIISLFGNAVVRFALPLYLLNQTGSSALYGTVMACAFIPMIILSPVGGMIADRVNKRNIMVALDFTTAGLILVIMSKVY